MYHAPPSVLAHFTAAVHQTAIIERRKCNSTQGSHAPPLSFDPDTFLTACMALFARSAKSTHSLAEQEENRLKIQYQYYNWTPKISPLDKWQHDWIASGVFEEGANSSRHAFRCLIPSTLQQLVGAFSSPRQINQQFFYFWQPRHRHRHRPLLPPAPPPPQPSTPQHHMSSGTNAGTTHQPHYHYHAAPPIPRRFPR